MRNKIANLIDSSAAAKSRKALEAAVEQFANSFDADLFAFVISSDAINELVTNYPEEWCSRYVSGQYERLDPVYTTAKRLKIPFSWTLQELQCSTPQECRILDEAAEFDIRGGSTIPISLAYGSMALLTIASTRGPINPNFNDHIASCAVAVVSCANTLYSLPKATPIAARPSLTLRQSQCLTWASYGKSAHDISAILGISDSAVCFHIKEARRQLQAKTVTHAVRKALENGLIS